MGLLTYFALGLLIAGPSLKGVADAACCPMGWLPLKGYCYKIFTQKMTWSDAAIACQTYFLGCNLASIHSTAESAELAWYVSKYRSESSDVWIGLRDAGKNQQWRWIDNSQVRYMAWSPGMPSKQRNYATCVALYYSSGYMRWNDEYCSYKRQYLCKFKL